MNSLLYKLAGLAFALPLHRILPASLHQRLLRWAATTRFQISPPSWHPGDIYWDNLDYENGELVNDGSRQAELALEELVHMGYPRENLRIRKLDDYQCWTVEAFCKFGQHPQLPF